MVLTPQLPLWMRPPTLPWEQVLGAGGNGSARHGCLALRSAMRAGAPAPRVLPLCRLRNDAVVCDAGGMGAPTVSAEKLSVCSETCAAVLGLAGALRGGPLSWCTGLASERKAAAAAGPGCAGSAGDAASSGIGSAAAGGGAHAAAGCEAPGSSGGGGDPTTTAGGKEPVGGTAGGGPDSRGGGGRCTPLAALLVAEVGGGNCLEPLLVGQALGLPVLDADCMGRAFPELQVGWLGLEWRAGEGACMQVPGFCVAISPFKTFAASHLSCPPCWPSHYPP